MAAPTCSECDGGLNRAHYMPNDGNAPWIGWMCTAPGCSVFLCSPECFQAHARRRLVELPKRHVGAIQVLIANTMNIHAP